MRIPITMCHGVNPNRDMPLDAARFAAYFRMAADMGFESISYDQLAAWRAGDGELPARPIMFDFDHPSRSIGREIHPVMAEFGYRGNLFVNTGPMEDMYAQPLPDDADRQWMTWDELGELMVSGWHIGAHTHTHPNLSKLSVDDPTGEAVRAELVKNDDILKAHLGVDAKDFAFTGTSWSSAAEQEVKQRYRFGRLWIVRSTYQADGADMRYADLVGVPGDDEADGGPPMAARYITADTPAYRLPSMEIERLIFEFDAFRRYLEGALGA